MARKSTPVVANSSAPGASTVLPGVPLPSWALPAEPVQPEPPAVEAPAPVPVAVGAVRAVGLAEHAVVADAPAPLPMPTTTPEPAPLPMPADTAPVPDPEDWAALLAAGAFRTEATEAPIVEPAGPDLTMSAPQTDGWPAEPVESTAAFDLPVPTLEPLPEAESVAGAPTIAAGVAAYEVEQIPHSHRTGDESAAPAPEKRRLFGRRKAAAAAESDGPAQVAEVAAVAAVVTVGALDLPAPVGPPAPMDAAVPVAPGPVAAAPVAAAPDAAAPPIDLPAPWGAPVPEAVLAAPDSPASRSRRPLLLLLALGIVAVLAAVAAFVWPGLLVSPPDDEAAPVAPRPAASSPAPAAPAAVTLQVPASVAGLTALQGAAATALTTTADAATLPGFTAPVSAVYATAGVPSATVIAWTATTPPGAGAVSTAFAGYESATKVTVSGIAPVDPGSLGGQMLCGTSTVAGKPASVCFWSDAASFGAVTVLAPASPAAGAQTAAAIRQGVETRS